MSDRIPTLQELKAQSVALLLQETAAWAKAVKLSKAHDHTGFLDAVVEAQHAAQERAALVSEIRRMTP